MNPRLEPLWSNSALVFPKERLFLESEDIIDKGTLTDDVFSGVMLPGSTGAYTFSEPSLHWRFISAHRVNGDNRKDPGDAQETT